MAFALIKKTPHSSSDQPLHSRSKEALFSEEEKLRELAMAFADTAARRLLRGAGGGVARGIAADAVGMSFALDGLWQIIAALFASAAHLLVLPFEVLGHLLAAAAHLLVLPFEALWHLLQSVIAGVSFCFDSLFATLGSAAHALVVPFEALWHLLQSVIAGVSFCFDSLFATLGSAAHALVVPFEALWHLLQSAAAGVTLCFGNLVAAIGSVPHALAVPFVALWHLLQSAAAVWFWWRVLGVAAFVAGVLVAQALVLAGVLVAQALVLVICICGRCLFVVAMGVGGALAYLLPICGQYCASVTMAAPEVAGVLISRAAFKAEPRMYFQILHLAGPLVASAVFSTSPLPWAVGLSVVALFSRGFSGGKEPMPRCKTLSTTPEEDQIWIHEDDQMWTPAEDQPIIIVE
uniref:Uncharacterized protein n=1 Tax=Aegilops tauschii TaxID=37682 RepID=M8BZ16_AEGTA